MMINMNEKIEIVEFRENNGIFSSDVEYKTIKTLCANIWNMSNSEFIESYSKYQSLLISFRVYYNRFTKDLLFKTKEYRVKWKDQYFDILAVQYKNKEYVDIKAKAVI